MTMPMWTIVCWMWHNKNIISCTHNVMNCDTSAWANIWEFMYKILSLQVVICCSFNVHAHKCNKKRYWSDTDVQVQHIFRALIHLHISMWIEHEVITHLTHVVIVVNFLRNYQASFNRRGKWPHDYMLLMKKMIYLHKHLWWINCGLYLSSCWINHRKSLQLFLLLLA